MSNIMSGGKRDEASLLQVISPRPDSDRGEWQETGLERDNSLQFGFLRFEVT